MTLADQGEHEVDTRNTHGLPVLPNELLLEIISHFTVSPPPSPNFAKQGASIQCRFERREALTALSETCSSLRTIFRPYIWDRVEVCNGMKVGKYGQKFILDYGPSRMKKKRFSREILRQLEVTTVLDPTLAQYVKIVDVEVAEHGLRDVFISLGRSFSLFPNLHTVKLLQYIDRRDVDKVSIAGQTSWRRGFPKRVRYPQIKSVILSPIAYPLLEACPNLRSFEGGTAFNYGQLRKFMKCTPDLRRFLCGRRISPRLALTIAEDFPLIQEISICVAPHERNIYFNSVFMSIIQGFKNLQTLIIEELLLTQTPHATGIVKEVVLEASRRALKGPKRVIFRLMSKDNDLITEETLHLPGGQSSQ